MCSSFATTDITMKTLTISCLILIVMCSAWGATISPREKEEDTELVLLHLIFRHGARTTYAFYPTDPNINDTFYPIGLGGLTNDGKMGEYKLGFYLRNMYGDFLGDVHTEDKVYIRSTDVTRTKMSAQLVLAGLFPPNEVQRWNDDLIWQPIPVAYKAEIDEDLFHPSGSCPLKVSILDNQPNIPEVQDIYIKPYEDVYHYIEENSKKPMNHPGDMQDMYFILKTESDMGLPIPEWTKQVYPDQVHDIAGVVYDYHNYDARVRKINAGYMLKKILDDSKAKIEGGLSPKERKVFLYSGHESTVGYMLNALKAYPSHVPPYGSAISFEIRKGAGDQYYVKLRYRNDTEANEPVDLRIPGCDVLCPFEKFAELQNELIPTISIQEACKDNSLSGIEKEVDRV